MSQGELYNEGAGAAPPRAEGALASSEVWAVHTLGTDYRDHVTTKEEAVAVAIIAASRVGASAIPALLRWFGVGAARALPQIAKASNREMLGQAISHVRALPGTAAQKADLFQQLGSQITKLSGGSWTAARGVGTEGSHVFLGGAGEALVINPAGQLFRGSLQTGGVSIAGPGKYAVDFAKLTGL